MQAVARPRRQRIQCCRAGLGPALLVVILALGGIGRAARAIELRSDDNEFTGHLDTTVTFGATLRVQNRDPGLVGVVNGGSAELDQRRRRQPQFRQG